MFIKQSSIQGKGVFADKNYSYDEEILPFEGNPKDVIYFNHSCDPNSYVEELVEEDMQTHILRALSVKNGEEITFDYSHQGRLYRDLWEKTIQGKCRCPLCI